MGARIGVEAVVAGVAQPLNAAGYVDWLEESARQFRASYENYLLSLNGAWSATIDTLPQGIAAARARSASAIANVFNVANIQLIGQLRAGLRQAALFGAQAAGKDAADPALLANLAAEGARGMDALLYRDLATINKATRNAMLRYDMALHVLGPRAAKMHAAGELGNDVFSQLDRAGRRYSSASFATTAARGLWVDAYVDGFLHAGVPDGLELAQIVSGVEVFNVSLTDTFEVFNEATGAPASDVLNFSEARPTYFHPNSSAELRRRF